MILTLTMTLGTNYYLIYSTLTPSVMQCYSHTAVAEVCL